MLFTTHKPHSLGSDDGPTVPSDGPIVLDLRFDREMKIPHRQKSTLILQLLSSLLLLPSTALVSEPLKATKTSRHCDPIRKDLVSSWKRISARGRIKVSTW